MNQVSWGVPVLLVCAVFAGCSSTPVATPPAATPAVAPQPLPADTSASSKPAPAPAAGPMVPAYLDPNNPISTERSVYFDFDDSTIKDKFAGLIERQGKYLVTVPGVSVKVEGNADERGSAEYNLALGQRRAEAVVKALKIYGAKDTQMEPVSWGKEHAHGHDESSWAQDRRADIVYPKR